MQRNKILSRPDWKTKVGNLGLIWHSFDNTKYWNEDAYYSFSMDEVDKIYAATEELYHLFIRAGDYVINNKLFAKFGIPDFIVPYLVEKWKNEPPALNYGRFDFGFDGKGEPKLFEFNCDTPTSLLEAAVAQWQWKQDVFPKADQYNSIEEKLMNKFQDLKQYLPDTLHMMHSEVDFVGEDAVTTSYLKDLADSVGIHTVSIVASDIGWDGKNFIDMDNRPIEAMYKLYPWEWLVKEEFGKHIPSTNCDWLEPVWKMMFSNKAILPILWEMNPNHPNLLEASFEKINCNYAAKPILGREGSNITLNIGCRDMETTEGNYGDGPFVFQRLYNMPNFEDNYPVIGSWIVDGEPCGMGIREGGRITSNASRFVPHIIGE